MQTPGCYRFEGRGSLVGYWPEPFHINWRPQGDSSPFRGLIRRHPGPRIRYNVRAFLILLISVFNVPIDSVCPIGTPLKTCAVRLLAW